MKFLLLILFAFMKADHYEKFFEIDGGPEYMYYFAKFYVGSPEREQSAIIDTGSDTLAFPCEQCSTKNCGDHQDPRFITEKSKTFKYDIKCENHYFQGNTQVCKFVKSYAEGSSLYGFLADDLLRFKNAHQRKFQKISQFNKFLKNDLRLKAEFGCTTRETGLFYSQYADGILGLDNNSSFIESVESNMDQKDKFILSFGICFHSTGGIMSFDLRQKDIDDEKITMLKQDISQKKKPLVLDYNKNESYYYIDLNKFQIGDQIVIQQNPYSVMIDSGTTFSHFPDAIYDQILAQLNIFCKGHQHKCGMIKDAQYKEYTCLDLEQPDPNYNNGKELLDSFPDILFYFNDNQTPYRLKPSNYFYQETSDQKNVERYCIAIKGGEQGRIILGAFGMTDYYFYFDRKSHKIMIFEEDCQNQSTKLLKKERILEVKINKQNTEPNYFKMQILLGVGFTIIGLGLIYYARSKKQKQVQLIKLNIIQIYFQILQIMFSYLVSLLISFFVLLIFHFFISNKVLKSFYIFVLMQLNYYDLIQTLLYYFENHTYILKVKFFFYFLFNFFHHHLLKYHLIFFFIIILYDITSFVSFFLIQDLRITLYSWYSKVLFFSQDQYFLLNLYIHQQYLYSNNHYVINSEILYFNVFKQNCLIFFNFHSLYLQRSHNFYFHI